MGGSREKETGSRLLDKAHSGFVSVLPIWVSFAVFQHLSQAKMWHSQDRRKVACGMR